jgi:hypothetical protein
VRLFPVVALACAMAMFASRSSGQARQEADVWGQTIRYSGKITPEGVDRFKSEASRGGRILEITSGGGDEDASLDMADEVRRRGMTVIVRGFCMSGCANAVFVAAERRVLLDGAVIGLHGSAIANRDSYLALHETPPAAVLDASARYEALYRARGVSIRLLQCAAVNIGQTTRHIDTTDPLTGAKARGWISRRSLWAPSDEALQRFGVSLQRAGAWPESDDQRRSFLSTNGIELPAGVVWGAGLPCQ